MARMETVEILRSELEKFGMWDDINSDFHDGLCLFFVPGLDEVDISIALETGSYVVKVDGPMDEEVTIYYDKDDVPSTLKMFLGGEI